MMPVAAATGKMYMYMNKAKHTSEQTCTCLAGYGDSNLNHKHDAW